MMDSNLTINMDAISPLLQPGVNYLYGPPGHHQYADTTASSETTSPVMASFDVSIMSEFNNIPTGIYPSPVSSRETASPQPVVKREEFHADPPVATTSDPTPTCQQSPPSKTPAKRKRENRYKNAPPSVISRRRAQNRASQRAYRERKDQRIRDLEMLLDEFKQKNDALSQAYGALQVEFLRVRDVQAGAQRHPGMSVGIPFSPSPPGPATPCVEGMPMVDGWQYYPSMAGYSV